MLTVDTPAGFWSAMGWIYIKNDVTVHDSDSNMKKWLEYKKSD